MLTAGAMTAALLIGAGPAAATAVTASPATSAGSAPSGQLPAGTVSAATAGASVAAAPVPKLTWSVCGDPYRCATAKVPQDWSKPTGATIDLALVKIPASSSKKIGTVFVNPGGPGGSGVDMLRSSLDVLPAGVRSRFDIVSFDPRFLGASRPLATCMNDTNYLAMLNSLPAFPVTSAQETAYENAYRRYTNGCASLTALKHASTGDVARDLDLLRAAVGDSKLSYVGYSYGTFIGQVYAQLFPGRVRAMVLDGVVDSADWIGDGSTKAWSTTPFSTRVGSDEASSTALTEFFRLCAAAGQSRCALAANPDPATAFAQIAARVKAKPVLLLGSGRTLDYPALISATASVLYSPSYWAGFAEELQGLYTQFIAADQIPQAGTLSRPVAPATTPKIRKAASKVFARAEKNGNRPVMPSLSMLPQRADKAVATPAAGSGGSGSGAGTGVKSSRYEAFPQNAVTRTAGSAVKAAAAAQDATMDNSQAVFAAVSCTDTRNPASASAWPKASAAAQKRSTYFGAAWAWSSIYCASWPFTDSHALRGKLGVKTAAPALVIGTRYDPATPYSAAQRTAARFPGWRLLTVAGYGHTSGALPSTCTDNAVVAYLVNGKLPAAGAVCSQNTAPFAP